MSAMPKPRGRQFFANPGPTNIPDSVLHAVAHVTVDFNDPAFLSVYEGCVAGLKRILKTEQELFFYTASGHGAWEASLVNLLSPGDQVLVLLRPKRLVGLGLRVEHEQRVLDLGRVDPLIAKRHLCRTIHPSRATPATPSREHVHTPAARPRHRC